MLTFILLVVLACGVGLIAVSAAERSDPATPSARSRRGHGATGDRERFEHEPQADDAPWPTDPRTDAAPTTLPATSDTTPPPGPVRRRRRGEVPAAFTAVEGAFQAVAFRPPARRLVSLALLLTLVIVIAAVIAGVTGFAAATIGRILDRAIG